MEEMKNPTSGPEEDEFERAMREARPRIVAVGCGGAGGNTISRLMEDGISGVKTIAVNTDAQDLIHTNADSRILIGREVTGGLGAGGDPELGEVAATEDEDLLKDPLYEVDMSFITCGLGGGTGTGAGPIVADVSKRMGALTVGVLTLPFSVEGERRARNATVGLAEFREVLDSILIIPDDKLLEIVPDLSIEEAFRLADRLLADSIKGIIELVTMPGVMNLDFADIETILRDGGVSMMGIGESGTGDRAIDAAEEALESPLLEADLSKAGEALVSISGGPSMTLGEAERIADKVSEALAPDAQVNWGAQISEDLEEAIRVMIIIPGVHSPWARGIEARRKQKDVEEGLRGLKYI